MRTLYYENKRELHRFNAFPTDVGCPQQKRFRVQALKQILRSCLRYVRNRLRSCSKHVIFLIKNSSVHWVFSMYVDMTFGGRKKTIFYAKLFDL